MQQPLPALPELTIERISHDGRGIARWQGKTLFVEGALPGEQVQARLIRHQSRFGEAVTDAVLQSSPERVHPPCRHFATCGGCQLQHMQPGYQLETKQAAVLEQLERWAGLKPEQLLEPVTSMSQGYRSRARLGIWYDKRGGVTLGFRQRGERRLTDVTHCPVLEPRLQALIDPLRRWLQRLENRGAITHSELVSATEGPAVVLRQVSPLTEPDEQSLRALAEQSACQVWLQKSRQNDLYDLQGNRCDPRLSYSLGAGLDLKFHPRDFTQVNQAVNRHMVDQALNLLDLGPDDQVLDLFCGIGNFTLALARHCYRVIGVEAQESMVARGRENAARLEADNVTFLAADLSKLPGQALKRRCGQVTALLLDPPREGAQQTLASVGQLAPEKLVYVSCNPATLARDAGTLADNNYRLKALGVLDMFPHTAHIESMALFERC